MIPFSKIIKTNLFALTCAFYAAFIIQSCSEQNHKIKLYNPGGTYRKDEVIILSRTDIEQVTGKLNADNYLEIRSGLHSLPVQFDDLNGDSIWDEMAFSISLKAYQEKVVSLKKSESLNPYILNSATWVHLGVKPSKKDPAQALQSYTLHGENLPWDDSYYPFQLDGPAWENDKVGFRLYLDGRNAKDIFAKRLPDLVLSKVGLDSFGNPVDNYHELEDWGRDVLQVGNSLGAGGLAILKKDSLYRLGTVRGAVTDVVDSTHFRIINTGPVRAIFSLYYKGWHVKDDEYDLIEIISINKGEYCYHSSVRLQDIRKEARLVTGMANLDNDKPLQVMETDNKLVLLSHDKQTYNKEYYLGMAMAVEKKPEMKYNQATGSGSGIVSSYYISVPSKPDNQLNYTFYACCELSNPQFKNSNTFFEFIQNQINEPKVEIHFIN